MRTIRPLHLLILAGALGTPVAAQEIQRVSVGTGSPGAQSDGPSGFTGGSAAVRGRVPNVCLGGDGRYIAFSSTATNLTSTSTSGVRHVFVRDRTGNTTTLVSKSTNGTEANNASAIAPVIQSPASSSNPDRISISADGRYIAFSSLASNLIDGVTDTDGLLDVFVRDTVSNTTVQLDSSSLSSHMFCPEISANGDYIAVELEAGGTSTIAVYRRSDLARIAGPYGGSVSYHSPCLSANGSILAAGYQYYQLSPPLLLGGYSVTDILASGGPTNIFSWPTPGNIAPATTITSISADGHHIAGFYYNASTVWPAGGFVNDYAHFTGTNLGSNSNGSFWPRIGGEARYVAFESDSSTFVTGDTNGVSDVFVLDRDSDENGVFDEFGGISYTRASVSASGAQATGASFDISIGRSCDDVVVSFASVASDLISGDTNSFGDAFFKRPLPPKTPVQAEIAILLDGSGSVQTTGWAAEKQAWANAISNQSIVPRNGSIAMSIVVFSDTAAQVIPWTHFNSATAVDDFVDQLLSLDFPEQTTDVAGGINVIAPTFCSNSFASNKRTILVSGDGQNDGGEEEMLAARNNALLRVTNIDGIGVYPPIYEYYRDFVVGGSNGLAICCASWVDGMSNPTAQLMCSTSRLLLKNICPGDFDQSGYLNANDFMAFMNAVAGSNQRADLNGNGMIGDANDYATFMNSYAAGCGTTTCPSDPPSDCE